MERDGYNSSLFCALESPYFCAMVPIQQVKYVLPTGQPFQFSAWREDLNHPLLQGNKFWKLKYNIEEVLKSPSNTLLTFGGAYSNHIHACALAGKLNSIQTIGVIRGEEPKTYSPTLQFARDQGMKLHFVSREAYNRKNEPNYIETLHTQFGPFHLVPEGGSNALGLKGCEEWGKQLANTADIYCLAAGTCCTAAGIAKALLYTQPGAEIWAFSALKNGSFLKDEAEYITHMALPNLHVITDYHLGGYAKYSTELLHFIRQMKSEHNLPLEQVYTAKTVFGLLEMAANNRIPINKRVCFIHTGGLQGLIDKL